MTPSLIIDRTRLTLGQDGHTLSAEASDLRLYGWPDFLTVRYGTGREITTPFGIRREWAREENVFTRVGFDRDKGGEIRAARYGNRLGQNLIIYND